MSIERFAGVRGDVTWDRVDIRRTPALSVDLRTVTGGPLGLDSVSMTPPGVFLLSVCKPLGQEPPIGEILIWAQGRTVHVVGALTGRPGLVEVTPDQLMHPQQLAALRTWVATAPGVH